MAHFVHIYLMNQGSKQVGSGPSRVDFVEKKPTHSLLGHSRGSPLDKVCIRVSQIILS
jgi:hypothetical protein